MRALLVDAQLLHDGDDTLEQREIDLNCFGVEEKIEISSRKFSGTYLFNEIGDAIKNAY